MKNPLPTYSSISVPSVSLLGVSLTLSILLFLTGAQELALKLDDLEFLILLPLPPKSKNYRHVPPLLAPQLTTVQSGLKYKVFPSKNHSGS